jgi:hypothetical protein
MFSPRFSVLRELISVENSPIIGASNINRDKIMQHRIIKVNADAAHLGNRIFLILISVILLTMGLPIIATMAEITR